MNTNAKRTALVAEDDLVCRGVMRASLEKMGFEVDEVTTGEDAVQYAKNNTYDIIFMDLGFTRGNPHLRNCMDGLQATRKIRANDNCCPPIISISGWVRKEDREQCLAAGMTDFLSKPMEYADIVEVIKTADLYIAA